MLRCARNDSIKKKTVKKNILIVTSEFPPQPGGIGNHAYNLASQLSLNNYKVAVIADQRSLDGEEEQLFDAGLNYKVHRIKIKRFRVLMYLQRLIKLMALVRSVDVVIASGKFSLWNAGFCSLYRKRKFIAVVHGTEVNFKNTYLRKSIELSLKRFDHVIAVSNHTKSLIAYLNLNVAVIPNGYDSDKWNPSVVPFERLTGSPILVTVGNVTSRKGQLNVISHLPILKLKYPNIHYHCIGLPTEADDFLSRATELMVADHVSFHGRLDDLEMQSMLMASDIFVMLSNETTTGDIEGFGIAVIEANALGIPAIGAAGSGLEDAIVDELTGFLVPHNDADAFLNSMVEILKKHDAFRQASIKWSQKHQWQIIIKYYMDIIRNK
nr:glycosyltransferase family 4 protein [Gelidibacter japonicus]